MARKTANPATLAMLQRVPLFAGLREKEVRSIQTMGREVDFAAGTNITSEGEQGVAFFLILDGRATVLVGGKVKRQLGPGDFVGEIALLDGGPRSATVRCETPVRGLALVSWTFRPLLLESPEVTYKILVEVCRRLRAADRESSA